MRRGSSSLPTCQRICPASHAGADGDQHAAILRLDRGRARRTIYLSVARSLVLATGITSTSGGKGSGSFSPSSSDLITSGGVAAPERLQFLLWTVLGVIAFLFYTLAIGPNEITELPPIPRGFLELMGISSAGYIGGKLARGPGPKIVRMTGQVTGTQIALKIDGAALGTKGAS
jgi:hypothetical protein